MSDVSGVSGASALSNLQISTKTADETEENELGQTAFLELMIAQLNNQNPLDPQDNSAFIAELAQFSSVEGIQQLNNNFSSFSNSFMSNQALQASSLVGTSVTVPATSAALTSTDIVSGIIDLPASTSDLSLNIYSDSGELVDTVDIGSQSAGEVVFRWDGYNMEVNGELLDWNTSQEGGAAAGTYTFEALATVDGEPTQLDTSLSANVNSVTVAADGTLTLNLAGLGPVSVGEVKQFN